MYYLQPVNVPQIPSKTYFFDTLDDALYVSNLVNEGLRDFAPNPDEWDSNPNSPHVFVTQTPEKYA